MDHRLVAGASPEDDPLEGSPRTEAIVEALSTEYQGEKIVLYSPSLQYLRLFRSYLRMNASQVDEGYRDPLEISGDNPDPEERRRAQEAFLDFGSGRNLMLVTSAGTEALNLQSAEALFVASMPPSGGDMVQLAGRICRIGSEHRSLLITYFLTEGSMDEDEYRICQQQMHLMSLIGDVDEGLIDRDDIRSDYWEGMTDEEIRRSTVQRVLLKRRDRRAEWYEHQDRGLGKAP